MCISLYRKDPMWLISSQSHSLGKCSRDIVTPWVWPRSFEEKARGSVGYINYYVPFPSEEKWWPGLIDTASNT
jgi:hypothetical protein